MKRAAPKGELLPGQGITLRNEIRAEMSAMIEDVSAVLKTGQTAIWHKASELGTSTAHALNIGAFNAPSVSLLATAQAFTADLISSIPLRMPNGLPFMPQVESFITQATTGVISAWDAGIAIDRLVGWEGAHGVSYQAERIVRTEMHRLYSVATDAQIKQVAMLLPEDARAAMRKRWVSGPYRLGRRETHQEMDGQEVGWDEKFLTPDDNELAFPCDPEGVPEETINCMCTYEPVTTSIMEAAGILSEEEGAEA